MRFVGLCPSLAKTVISGISEKALKQVSSRPLWSCVGACESCDARKSRPAWNDVELGVELVSTRSRLVVELPQLGVGRARGVFAALSEGRSGARLGVLRVDGGGGIRSESLLPLLCSVAGARCSSSAGSGVRSGVVGRGADILWVEEASFDVFLSDCGMFSLSSITSI